MVFGITVLVSGVGFFCYGLLLLFNSRFLEYMEKEIWREKNIEDARHYNKYVRGIKNLITGIITIMVGVILLVG